MQIKFKKTSPLATMPTKAHPTDAGFDMTAVSVETDPESNIVTYDTGIAVEIPEGYVGLLFPRSSIYKTGQSACNSVGVIDSNFRGSIKLKTYLADNNVNNKIVYSVGERVAQLVIIPYPDIEFVEADSLSETDRGEGGYGSTGK